MIVQFKQLAFGVYSLALSNHLRESERASSSMESTYSDYCYAVWFRHMCIAHSLGLNSVPSVVVELGPGNSLGVGIMALLMGAKRYIALDVVKHNPTQPVLQVFDELVAMLRNRAPIAGKERYSRISPDVDNLAFPDYVTQPRLDWLLREERINRLRVRLAEPGYGGLIDVRVPWMTAVSDLDGTADMVITQTTLEYVPDLRSIYSTMRGWLSEDGYLSTHVDLGSHGYARTWFGHWCMSPLHWRLAMGRRTYFLNRAPYSTHRNLMREVGLKIEREHLVQAAQTAQRRQLARPFRRSLTDTDLSTVGVSFVATKTPGLSSYH